MIKSFRCADTEKLFNRERITKISSIENVARRKLEMLNAAGKLTDLSVPPGNRLEKLKGDRSRQHSIRINDQWRICFVWKEGNAYDVEIVDDH
ncbi:MAG TPA: type II toxin-antitoxin system RelE/ParE family toxin [Candidatus Acidoferrales bacterium]|nr:type II toxin-antitoxin system RelE/ParE family toxin [Candidatus Acidoferrales bacterium]